MLVRVVAREDGGVSVIRPVRQYRDGEPEDDYHAEVFGKAMTNDPALTDRPYADIDDDDLPSREHRDRWCLRDGRVVVGD